MMKHLLSDILRILYSTHMSPEPHHTASDILTFSFSHGSPPPYGVEKNQRVSSGASCRNGNTTSSTTNGRLLLRYGADVNHAVPSTDSGTVVQCSRCGRTQAAGNIKDNQYECTYCGNFTRHADASDSDHTGITALHAAVQKEGHLDVVVALLEHAADVDTVTAKVRLRSMSA
jgi:hypothetical protein